MSELSEKVRLGSAAERLLNDEVYKNAMAAVKDGILYKWEQCSVSDLETQHALKLMLKLLNDLQANIGEVLNTGKLALDRMNYEEGKFKKTLNIWRN